MYADRPPIETRDRYGANLIVFREESPREQICFRNPTEDDWSYCGWSTENEPTMLFAPSRVGQGGIAHNVVAHQADSAEQEFLKLAKQWKAETSFHSSLSKKFTHPAYQMIMAMGKEALPFILDSLEREPDDWFYALKFIVRRDIGQGARSFEEAREKWIAWGKTNNYL